ncbi:MAG: hypothetical protein ACR2RB_12565 [Gammaproteobacteria bacterium]
MFWLRQNDVMRMSGLTFTGSSGPNGNIRFEGDNNRVDDIRFASQGGHPIVVRSNPVNSVIDNCTFEASGRGVNVLGDAGYWTDASQFAPGTTYGVYIENSVFNRGGVEVLDINRGGAYVVRHSTFNNGGNAAMHGADSGDRAGGYVEIYENTFNNTGISRDFAMISRGGVMIAWRNKILGPHNQAIKVQNWRSCFGVAPLVMHGNNQNRCTQSSDNPFDGKERSPGNGYPCKDQFGRGPNQSLQISYQWANTWDRGSVFFNVANVVPGCSNPSTQDHVQSGRDYFDGVPRPGYTGLVYPHPLVTLTSGGATAPILSAPTNLKVESIATD